jgi:hypothetical protein
MKTIYRISLFILLTGIIICNTGTNLFAQEGQSLIYGTVVIQYSSGEVILNGATIEIYNSDTLFASTVTSESGSFSFNKVPFGIFYLKVRTKEDVNPVNSSTGVPVRSSDVKFYSFQETVKSTRIKFKVDAAELNLSKITVFPVKQ